MKRIAIGAVTGLAVWFGSALAAEAQQITPTGPMKISPGDTSATFSATVTLPYSSYFYVKVLAWQNGACIALSQTFVPNPGTTTYDFSKLSQFNTAAQGGATITFQSCLIFAGHTYVAQDWNVLVAGTRPSSKVMAMQKAPSLTVQANDHDRRRE